MKKKIIILIVILVILAIGGCAAYAVLFTDLFKSDKEMFLTYLGKNISNLEVLSDDDLVNYLEKQNKTPYKNDGNFEIKINGEDSQNISLSFEGDVDKQNDYNYQQIKLNYSDDVSAEIDFLKDENYIGVTIPEVIKKYLTIDTDNIKQLAKNFGVEDTDDIPDKINLKTNIKANKNSEGFKLKDNYKELLLNSIKDENIIKTKTDIYTKYSYTTTVSEIKDTANQILEAIKNDEESLNEYVQEYKENYNASEEEAEEYKDYLNETLQYLIDELDKETDYDDEPIEIAVYVQGKNLMKTEISDGEDVLTVQFSEDSLEIRTEEKYEEQLQTVFDINIKKTKDVKDLSYNIEAVTEESTLKVTIDFSDLLDVEKVEEKYSISVGDEVTASYETTKKFVENIDKKELTEKDRYIINTKSMEKISNMAQQLLISAYQLHMNKMQEAGLSEDPITNLLEGDSSLNNQEDENEENDENSTENSNVEEEQTTNYQF